MDYCKYADLFYGNGEVDHYYNDGLASKWFYIKALCGNTTPNAVLPFGKISAGAYSGGYPCGYGTHYPNCCGKIEKLSDKMKVRGVSHIHHSGTGAISFYYNYAITTPFYGDVSNILNYYELQNEEAQPGYYKMTFNNIDCELTVTNDVAYHHYYFEKDNGRIAVDFSNDGLAKEFGELFYAFSKDPYVEVTPFGEVLFSGVLSGIKLYFCVAIEAENSKAVLFEDITETDAKSIHPDPQKPFGAIFDFDGNSAIVKLSYSTLGFEQAKQNVRNAIESFDSVMNKAYVIWGKHLSRIEIETDDDELKQKFYSNLYHSLIKPVDMTGENIMGVSGNCVSGISTFWDQYKTVFPLIFMAYPEFGKILTKGVINISETIGMIPSPFCMTAMEFDDVQAKMLGIYLLCDAYYYGIDEITIKDIEECIKRELDRDDFKTFIKKGVFERYTHIVDTTDACLYVAKLTDDLVLKHKLMELANNLKNAFDDDGIMSVNSPYYEGDRYTYSFRPLANMDERIKIAGGKEQFAKMLDKFFGFGEKSVTQANEFNDWEKLDKLSPHRFEGFNNESDMEAPFSYIYVDQHNKLCEIIDECVNRTFTTGRGGLPGNNDSGGLSSLFVWYCLGLFPKSGSGEMFIGSPHINKATVHLSGGNKLEIVVNNGSKTNIYVDSVKFNDKKIDGYKLDVCELIKGGKLEFNMK